jgi:hypothetical protein
MVLTVLSVYELVLSRKLGCATFRLHQKGVKRCVVLLYGLKLWKVLKVTAVCVLSLSTELFDGVYMNGQKCSRSIKHV